MDYSSIIDIEKSYFSEIHSKFDTFIKMLKSKDKVSEEVLHNIILLNKKMQELSSDFEDLNYTLQKTEKRKTEKMKKNIKLYEENDKIIKECLPYMIYYRHLLN
jgi:hypothetical protein